MKKIVTIALLTVASFCETHAQSNFDRNKVVDFFQNQQFEEAINYLIPIANTDSQNVQVLGYLGFANYMSDNNKMADKYYKQIISIDSNNLSAVQFLSNKNNTDNADLAQIMTGRLISLQPTKSVNYRNMGKLLRAKRRKDSALLYFNTAYNLSPSDYKNIAGLAEILIDIKSFKRADSLLELGLKKDSINTTLLKLRVRSAYDAKDYEGVIIPGERLIRINEIALNALMQLFMSYYNLKMYNDCIRVCDFLLSNDLDGETIFYYKAKSWANLKEYSKSNHLLQICLDKSIPDNIKLYYFNLGQNYESLNQFNKAIAHYDTAYYFSKDPLMIYNVARIYETKLNNRQLAQKKYENFLTIAKPKTDEEKKIYAYVK